MSVYDDWAAFVDFVAGVTTATGPLVDADLRCPVPAPRQVFAIGLNYRSHAEESGMAVPSVPASRGRGRTWSRPRGRPAERRRVGFSELR